MPESSWPYTGGQGVTDASYERLMAKISGNGRINLDVAGNALTTPTLYADNTGRHVKVRANHSYLVRGFTWDSGSTGATVALDANTSGNPRLDYIVLRLDRSNFTVRLAVVKGTPAAVPTVPALTLQTTTTGIWEYPLGYVKVISSNTSGQPFIGAGDVTPWVNIVAHPPVIGPSSSRPAVQPGSLYTEYDTNRTYIGLQSKWHLIGEDGTETQLTQNGSNWEPSSFYAYATRRNGFVYFQALIYRKAGLADSPAGTDIPILILPEQFRFKGGIYGDGAMGGNTLVRWYLNGPTGNLALYDHAVLKAGNFVHIGPVCWPANY